MKVKKLIILMILSVFTCRNLTGATDYNLASQSPFQTSGKSYQDLSRYHPLSVMNRIDFERYVPTQEYQGGEYPEELRILEKALTVCAAGWDGAKSGDYNALVAPAGMPAINLIVDSAMRKKELGISQANIVVIEPPYACTKNLFENWDRAGLEVRSISVEDIDTKLADLIDDNTVLIYGESVVNPTLRVLDIKKVLKTNKGRAVVAIDDTFATTEGLMSLREEVMDGDEKYSVDMVMLGLTKGMTGSGNIISGAVVAKKEWLQLLVEYRDCLVEKDEIERVARGIRHLEQRFKAQSRNASALIDFIGRNGLVASTTYPGNGYMTYSVFNSEKPATDFINLLSKFRALINAVSLGQLRTLFEQPAGGTHITVNEAAQAMGAITAAGIRGAIGVENIDDLLRELEAIFSVLALYDGEMPEEDLQDINKIFMAEFVRQEEDKRDVKYLLPKWPMPNATFEKLISSLSDEEKEKLRKRHRENSRFREAVSIIMDATEITKYDPVTVAIHHRHIWGIISGNHSAAIGSPELSTTVLKQDAEHMQKTFLSILKAKDRGLPPEVAYALYSRLGRPGIASLEVLMTMLEVGVENAFTFKYIPTSFYTETMAHKTFLMLNMETAMMNMKMGLSEKDEVEIEKMRQDSNQREEYLRLQKKAFQQLRSQGKEIIIVTQKGSFLYDTVERLKYRGDAVMLRVIVPERIEDINGILEKEVSDKTLMVYFDSVMLRGSNPEKARDIVKKNNSKCRFGITDSFNLGYEGPRQSRDLDFIIHVSYYEKSNRGAVVIERNNRPLNLVWQNLWWARKNMGVSMSENNAVLLMCYSLPYLRVFDERYEENSQKTKGILETNDINTERIDKRHLSISFKTPEEAERFLACAEESPIIDVYNTPASKYFTIDEWTEIRPDAGDSSKLVLRIGIEYTKDLERTLKAIVSNFQNRLDAHLRSTAFFDKANEVETAA